MIDLPTITIGVITYSRFNEVQQAVASLRDNLIYPPDKLQWIIADDCSPNGYIDALKQAPVFNGLNVRFISTPVNSGWGASANNLLEEVDTAYVYLTEDDFILSHPLDLRSGVGILETEPSIGVLRYGGTSGNFVYHYRQAEANVSEYVKENIYAADYVEGRVTYLIIDKSSPTLYIHSGRPALGKLNWYYRLGLFPVGLTLGSTEECFAHRVKDYLNTEPDAQQIAILPDFINMKYRHIGQTFQHTEIDVAREVGQ